MKDLVYIELIGWNWYDYIILMALIVGLWQGIRSGLSKIASITIGSLLVLTATLKLYQTIYDWLQQQHWFTQTANSSAAIVAIVVGVYLPVLIISQLFGKWIQRRFFPVFLENFGGEVLGLISLAAILAWLNVGLMLTCNQSVQRLFLYDSWIGLRLASQLTVR